MIPPRSRGPASWAAAGRGPEDGPSPPATGVGAVPATVAAVAVALLAAPATGQEPAPADTVAADTVPADTLPADSLRADGAGADTARADGVPGEPEEADTVPADTAGGRDRSVEDVQESLAGGGFPERDSLFRRLAGEQGYRVVEYRGRDVALDVPDRRIRLRDSAQANYSDAALQADSITYRARLQFMSARGDIRLASPDQRRMTTDSVLYYDVSRLKGTVLDARTSFAARGAEWLVRGDAVPVGRRTLYVNRGSFTSCDRETPHYYFRAGQIKMVSQDVIVAWPVTLYVADVPVFWLPFFAQDIRPDRRSGIVPPDFGFNTIVRTEGDMQRQITGAGYYWAIDRFMDAKFTVDWFSGQFTRLNGDFRYNFRKRFIEGAVRVSREFADASNLQVDASHEQMLTPDTRLRADVRFVTQEELLRNRSFETEEQTQTIDSDVGLDHDFGFGSVTLSGRRQQSLGTEGRVDLTLPEFRLSLSPVTLFEAPRNRAGSFDNLTLSPGGLSFTRQERSRDVGDDVLTTSASVGPSLRLGDLSLSTSTRFNEQETTPFRTVVDSVTGDTVFRGDLDPRVRSTVNWSSSADYQVDLMGSTTLRPNVQVSGAWFRSRTPVDPFSGDTVPDTGGAFEQAPTRFSAGASLSTDLFGFLPGFGPFSSIRHKISPRFNWSFSPAATVSDSALAEVPGFPGGRNETENTLTVSLNQTFEAKMPVRDDDGDVDGRPGAGEGDVGDAPAAGAQAGEDGRAPADAGGEAPRDAEAAAGGEGGAEAAGGRERDREPRERTVTLLSIRSSSLRFDFNRPGPALATDRFRNSIDSDLFSGLDLTVEFDLLDGSGEGARFAPFLSEINASLSLRSGQSLADLVGLGGNGGRSRGAGPVGRPGTVGREPARDQGEHEAGPWTLSLDYSLGRRREEGASAITGRGKEQTLGGRLSLQPTPNWSMSWNTSYNIEEEEFTTHQVELRRNLHRWQARFRFRRAPNGNFTFDFFVTLTDAPELRIPYSQRSEPPR